MTAEIDAQGKEGQAPEGGRVVITFDAADPTNPTIRAERVSFGQVLAASSLLAMWAQELRNAQLATKIAPADLASIASLFPKIGRS